MGQLELDRYAEEFRKLHAERHEIVEQLDSLLETMQSRDEQIITLAEVYRHSLDTCTRS